MLKELLIENLVLINRAELILGPGFTALTGDTGAGKSLLVTAFKVLLGARADLKLVGKTKDLALIQAVFQVTDTAKDLLDEKGIPCHEDEVIIRRIISLDGKNRTFINGIRSTLTDLRAVTPHLVTLAGQHEFQRLLNPEVHRIWLDEYSNISTKRLSNLLAVAKKQKKALAVLEKKKRLQNEKKDELLDHAKLIDEISPKPLEDERLEEERQVLKKVEKIRALAQSLYHCLYGEREGILEGVSEGARILDKLASIDPKLQGLLERMESVRIELDDVAASVRDYLYDLPMDDTRLRQIEDRLFRLKDLRRRFGPSLEDVIRYRQDIEQQLDQLENLGKQIEEAQKALNDMERDVISEAQKISDMRKAAAKTFQDAVQQQLFELNLEKALFEVQVETPTKPTMTDVGSYGMDKVTFLFSANPGHELRPLSDVASGGELSRILLALKVVMGEVQQSELMVFDEIDSGIGGEVAERVGQKLKRLSRSAQVIAITHFPQIAALADRHFVVRKHQGAKTTFSLVEQVDGRKRIEEIARMLGGEGRKAKEYAKELLGPILRGA